ncbi:hypothetical protein D3C84_594270 [compost metagenome]
MCVDIQACRGAVIKGLRGLRIFVPPALDQQHVPTIPGQAQRQRDARRPGPDDAEVIMIAEFFLRLVIFDHVRVCRKYWAGNTQPLTTTNPFFQKKAKQGARAVQMSSPPDLIERTPGGVLCAPSRRYSNQVHSCFKLPDIEIEDCKRLESSQSQLARPNTNSPNPTPTSTIGSTASSRLRLNSPTRRFT